MVRRTSKKKAGSVSVNFKGVEIGGQKRIPEDDYLMRVVEITQEEGDKADYLKWVFKVDDGKYKGATFYVNTSLAPQALWKLGALLQALGHEVPDDEMDLDFEDYIDETLMGVVADEIYEGKKRSRMVDFYAVDEEDAEDEPEEKPKRGRKAKDEDEEEDEKPARKSRRRAKDEDEEEEAPKKRGSSGKSKFEPIASDDVQEMDEDELQDVIDRSGVEVDLDDYSTLRKKRAAVIDALEAADLIDDDGGEEEPEEDDRPTRGKKKPAAKDEEDEPEEDSAAARRKARRAARRSRG